MGIVKNIRGRRKAIARCAAYASILAASLLAGCSDGFSVLTESDFAYLPVVKCVFLEPTVSFTALAENSAVCDSLALDFNESNPRDTEHQASIDEENWVTAASGVTTFSALPGFGALPVGAGLTVYLKGKTPCNITEVNVIKTGPTVSITSPSAGVLVFGNDTVSFTDTVSTNHDVRIDGNAWFNDAASGITRLMDLGGFDALADGATFTLHVRGDDSPCNLASISAVKGGPSAFASVKTVTLDTTAATGAGVGNNVNNFPVLLRYPPGQITANSRPDAHDIRFQSSGGSWLDYEIELWDPLLDGLAIWVLVPIVYGNNNTQTIDIYYNEVVTDSIPDGQSPGRVFAGTNGFAGVWHMSDIPTGSSGDIIDSSSNGFNGTSFGMNSGNSTLGQAGNCLTFDGSDDLVSLGSHTYLQPENITLSFWIQRTTDWSNDTWVPIFGKSQDGNSYGWQFYISDNYENSVGAGLFLDGPSNYFYTYELLNTYYPLDTWVFIALSFDTTTNAGAIYRNGAAQSTIKVNNPDTITSTASTVTMIAEDDNPGIYWPGRMDELRVSNVVRSADWIRLCYENQKTGQTLVEW